MAKVLNLKTLTELRCILEKLTIEPQKLTEEEKVIALSCAIIFLKAFSSDQSLKKYMELAYFIILKYSLTFKDYEPLYDLSTNLGFYPITKAISEYEELSQASDTESDYQSISSALIPQIIERDFCHDKIVETLEQNNNRNKFIGTRENSASYVAPTSFGKSKVIAEHLRNNWGTLKRVAIIVPTKSLLVQTYQLVKSLNLDAKILIHDEMYTDQERFVGVFTQERALRLLDKNKNLFFDYLYIDEAHNLFEQDSRTVLLSRLIKLSLIRNSKVKIFYFSPLIENSQNLELINQDQIIEYRIKFNIKEPELFCLEEEGAVFKYNRFVDEFFDTGKRQDMFQYIRENQTEKSFFYLYSPTKIEKFARDLSDHLEEIENPSDELETTIEMLKQHVHEDFYAVELLKKGIVYLHGKLPDTVKEYLENKFSTVTDIRSIVANNVILEGVNLPIDSLFIMSGRNLKKNKLINLIGRVNRLDQIFKDRPCLEKLLPKIHFINSKEYNQKNGNLRAKIKLLKNTSVQDEINNPLLKHYDAAKEPKNKRQTCEEIILYEDSYFSEEAVSDWQLLKKRMIALNMHTVYKFSDELCYRLFLNIDSFLKQNQFHEIHFLDRLQKIFISKFVSQIDDQEIKRLQHGETISFYKHYFENRNMSLKDQIKSYIKYFNRLKNSNNSYVYVGKGWGDKVLPEKNSGGNVYVDLKNKNSKELVNLAIIKQNIEEDFVSYKLRMFFQLMLDYNLLTQSEYNQIIYGSDDSKKIDLIKMGLTINIINKLESSNQLKNIKVDKNGNLIGNSNFSAYKEQADDFFKFELNKYF